MLNRLRQAMRGSSLTLPKVVVTALAAVTVALVSSHLAGYLNTIALAGVASIVTAVSSEFYGAIFSAAAMRRAVTSSSSDTEKNAEEKPESEAEGSTGELESGTEKEAMNFRIWTRLSVLFLAVFLLAVGTSFLVSRATGEDHVYNRTVVVSETVTPSSSSTIIEQKADTSDIEERLSQLEKENEVLASQVASLQAEESSGSSSVPSATSGTSSSSDSGNSSSNGETEPTPEAVSPATHSAQRAPATSSSVSASPSSQPEPSATVSATPQN